MRDKPFPGRGLVVIGRHAGRFIAPAIRSSKKGRLVTVARRDDQRAKHFADEYDGPFVYVFLKEEFKEGEPR